MKRIALIAAILLCGCGRQEITRREIFINPTPESIPFRIPAIAAFEDGSLVAVADYRPCRADIGYGRVDLHCRLSGNNGRTWGDESIIVEGTGTNGSADCGYGDPAIVCDRESGELLLISVCGNTVYFCAERNNPNRIAAFRSSDKGRTWTEPKEITEDFYTLFDNCSDGCMQSCFVGSGKILQSRTVKQGSHYRIYAPLCSRPNGNKVIYSDDFGQTWHALGGADALPSPNGDEAKCEELADGSVILSSRTDGGRLFNIFRYGNIATGEGNWGEAAFSGAANNGCTALENACNGEILIVPAKRTEDKKKVSIVLQSVPLGPGRRNVGIYYKELPDIQDNITSESFAANWDGPYKVSDTASAYSTMAIQSDGRIAFFFEEGLNADRTGYNMVYTALPLSVITDGRYQNCQSSITTDNCSTHLNGLGIH